LDAAFRQLRRAVLMRDGAGLTDAQLLELFIAQKDQAAFEALVHRLGPMVLKVCRRVVGNHHDAEDVFQATFLLLARKASSLKLKDRVANWLHGVALRSSLNAKKLRAKNQTRERQLVGIPEPQAVQQAERHDLQPLLDQELSRLAEIYRLPILLCDLEGKSIKATAHQLGWPQGTVAGRLARGRKLLAKRLARHGLAVSGGAFLLQNSVSACVPPSLVASTVKAAGAYSAGKSAATGLISANVAILIQGGLTTMFWTKMKIAVVVLMVATIIALGGGVLLRGTAAGQQIAEAKDDKKPVIGQASQPREKSDTGKKDIATAKTDHDKLRGTRKVIEAQIGSKVMPSWKNSQWFIGRDKMAMHLPTAVAQGFSPGWDHASYHFWGDNDDAAPAPNNINMTFHLVTTSPDKKKMAMNSQTFRGLFALEGDTLNLCFRERATGKRPTEIPASSTKDDNLYVVVLQRETAAPKSDEEKLQGDWEMVGVEMDGEQMDLSKGAYRLSFVGDLMISTEHERNTIFKLDGTKLPKQFVQIWESDWVGLKIVGIYSLEGDELRICNPENEKDAPPDDFTAPEGSGRTLIMLKRVVSAGEGTPAQLQGRSGGTVDNPTTEKRAAEPAPTNEGVKGTEGDAKAAPSVLTEGQMQVGKNVIEKLGGYFEPFGGEHELLQLGKIQRIHAAVFEQATDNLLKKIPDFPFAFGVCLPSTEVTDAGMKEIAKLRNLSALMLIDTKVTDLGLRKIATLSSLRFLYLDQTKVTDAGLKELAALKNLQVLSLDQTKITDVGLKELGNLKDLRLLSLDKTNVTDTGLKELGNLKNLRLLSLDQTEVTDAGLKELGNLKNLARLHLHGTNVTDTGLRLLEKALPDCGITR
jgi:RNA polymerase sigma factor (sigma-70 family)